MSDEQKTTQRLEGVDRTSATWRALQDWIDLEVVGLDIANRNPDNTESFTQAIRVRTHTLLEIRELADPVPEPLKQAEAVALDAR